MQAGLRSDRDMSKGSQKVPKVLLPVRQLVQEMGLDAVADMYGVESILVKEVYDSAFPFIIKRFSKEMMLVYMGLDPNLNLGLDKLTNNTITQSQILKAGLGNGVHEVTTMSHLKPMMQNSDNAPKFQLSDEDVDNLLNDINREIELRVNNDYDKAAKGAEKIGEKVYETVDGWMDDNVDEEKLQELEDLEGKTRLTLRDAARIFDSFDLQNLPEIARVNFSTLFAEAAAMNTPIDNLLDLAQEALENGRILTDIEHAQFVVAVTKLKNELEDIRNSDEAGFVPNLSTDLQKEYELKLQQMDKLVRGDSVSGSATGRALSARRIALNNDYSFYGVIRRASNAKGSEGLTKAEIDKISKLQSKYEQAQNKINTLERKLNQQAELNDIDGSQTFFDQVLARKEKYSQGKINKLVKEIKKTLKNKGYDVGKFQLSWGINSEQAIDIRKFARMLILENNVKTLTEVVEMVKSSLLSPAWNTGVNESDIYGAISGRIQRVPKTETEATKRLKNLTLQANLQVQINNALQGIFDPKRTTKPPLKETTDLRNKLNELKRIANEDAFEETQTQNILEKVRQIELMLDGLYRPIRKPTKIKSTKIQEALDKLYTKESELRAQDRLLLLQTILEYGEPPVYRRQKRNPQSATLELYRTEIKKLEDQLKERKKSKLQIKKLKKELKKNKNKN